MPNHKSAEKRVRQNEKRREVNRGNRSRLRTGIKKHRIQILLKARNRTRMRSQIKKLRAALEGSDGGTLQETLAQTVSLIDKAVQKGVLHRNAAARYKSRLTVRAGQSGK